MLELLNETPQPLPLERTEETLEAYLQDLGITRIVTLILVSDATIHRLNFEDRGVDAPTDVLSYRLDEVEDASMTLPPEVEQLGDVFISLDTAARQAKEKGHDLETEVLTLAAHGITHLRGFDHPTEAAWQTFHQAQNRVLELHRTHAKTSEKTNRAER